MSDTKPIRGDKPEYEAVFNWLNDHRPGVASLLREHNVESFASLDHEGHIYAIRFPLKRPVNTNDVRWDHFDCDPHADDVMVILPEEMRAAPPETATEPPTDRWGVAFRSWWMSLVWLFFLWVMYLPAWFPGQESEGVDMLRWTTLTAMVLYFSSWLIEKFGKA